LGCPAVRLPAGLVAGRSAVAAAIAGAGQTAASEEVVDIVDSPADDSTAAVEGDLSAVVVEADLSAAVGGTVVDVVGHTVHGHSSPDLRRVTRRCGWIEGLQTIRIQGGVLETGLVGW